VKKEPGPIGEKRGTAGKGKNPAAQGELPSEQDGKKEAGEPFVYISPTRSRKKEHGVSMVVRNLPLGEEEGVALDFMEGGESEEARRLSRKGKKK